MIARNAADRLPEVLGAVDWADEICVADTGSSDNTLEIARDFGAVTKSIEFHGFGTGPNNRPLQMASYDWVLSLDSDEVLGLELAGRYYNFSVENRMNLPGRNFRA